MCIYVFEQLYAVDLVVGGCACTFFDAGIVLHNWWRSSAGFCIVASSVQEEEAMPPLDTVRLHSGAPRLICGTHPGVSTGVRAEMSRSISVSGTDR